MAEYNNQEQIIISLTSEDVEGHDTSIGVHRNYTREKVLTEEVCNAYGIDRDTDDPADALKAAVLKVNVTNQYNATVDAIDSMTSKTITIPPYTSYKFQEHDEYQVNDTASNKNIKVKTPNTGYLKFGGKITI